MVEHTTPRGERAPGRSRTLSGPDVGPARALGSRERTLLLLVGLLVLIVYASTASYTGMQFNDVRGAALGAWALVHNDGSVILHSGWDDGSNRFWLVDAGDGLAPNRFPGLFALGFPAYLLASLVGSGAATELAEVPMWPAAITGVVVSAAAAVLFGRYAIEVAGAKVGGVAMAAIAFGTPLWTFASRGLWPHGPSALLMSVMILALHRGRWTVAALAAGAMPLFRPHLAIVAVALALWVLRERGVKAAFAWLVPSGVAIGLLVLYSQVVFSTWLPAAGYEVARHIGITHFGLRWFGEQWLWGFAHQRIGLLLHSTYLLIILPFVATSWRTAPPWARVMFLAGLVYYTAQAALAGTQGGGLIFGYRVQLETVLLATPLLVHAARHAATAGVGIRIAGCVAVVVSIVLHAVALSTMWG